MVAKRSVARFLSRRCLGTTAAQLRLREEPIFHGLQGRLAGQAAINGSRLAHHRVAVLGSHGLDFAATFRAVRRAGAVAAPVDARLYDAEELTALLAEAQVHLAVLADNTAADTAGEAMRRLGKQLTFSEDLALEGATAQSGPEGAIESDPTLLLFAQSTSSSSLPRAVEVSGHALSTRLEAALASWSYSDGDVVLSLGLTAGENSSLIDAVEAPLAAGSAVEMVQCETVWDLWSSLETSDASVVFLDSKWCWRLVQSYESLAASVQQGLRERTQRRPFRFLVALAPPGTVLSEDLAKRWQEIFNCPLTWHFSCAEAGALYTVQESEGRCTSGLDWHTMEGDLFVRGKGLFSKYQGRPRSTREAFDEEGFFRTGHRAEKVEDVILPLPALGDQSLEQEVDRHLTRTPNVQRYPQMRPDWKIKKVPIRVYQYWKANWGGVLVTKKHNAGKEVYRGKYK